MRLSSCTTLTLFSIWAILIRKLTSLRRNFKYRKYIDCWPLTLLLFLSLNIIIIIIIIFGKSKMVGRVQKSLSIECSLVPRRTLLAHMAWREISCISLVPRRLRVLFSLTRLGAKFRNVTEWHTVLRGPRLVTSRYFALG